jgi:hypothetical protein
VPVLAEGAPCRVDRWQRGACGVQLACEPPADCPPATECGWPRPPGDEAGACRRRPAAGSLGGACARGADGSATCDPGLACEPSALQCRLPPDPEGGAGQRCRADLLRPCEPGLECQAEICRPILGEGEACGLDPLALCANGLECRDAADATRRCRRVGAEGTPCAGGSRQSCEAGLACVASTCVRAASAGAPCDETTRCEYGSACRSPYLGPRVCVPLASPGAPCGGDPRCAAGLTCRGYCLPLRFAGEACDPAVHVDSCEGGFTCLGGRCAGPAEGEVCADGRCGDGLRCVATTCVRPRDPGEPCAPTDPRTTCRADSACADGVCRLLGTRDAACRRGPGAACDAGLRCDLVTDRCAP